MWLDRTRRMRRDVAMMSAFDTYWDAAAMIDNSFYHREVSELLFCAASGICVSYTDKMYAYFLHTNKGSTPPKHEGIDDVTKIY